MRSKMSVLLRFWRALIVVFLPMLMLPLPLIVTSDAGRCAYVMLIVAVFWMTEALPLEITALIPVFAFPLLGVLSTDEVCVAYMNKTNMMLLGGLMLAVAIEHCNLHRRIALFVILHVGQSPKRLMAGFMISTAFLSIWISNAAATAMMVPIVDAIMQELSKVDKSLPGEEGPLDGNSAKNLKYMCFLATAYAANIGGTGSPLGSGANLVSKNLIESSFTEPTGWNFGSWILFSIPGLTICVILTWLWLQLYFFGIRNNSNFDQISEEKRLRVRNLIQEKYQELGSVTFHEAAVIGAFIFALGLWFFRQPGYMKGWASIFRELHTDIQISDATPAILVVVILAAVPATLNIWPWVKPFDKMKPSEGCLTWDAMHRKLNWSTVVLVGGGFAMAKAASVSQLSVWVGEQMKALYVLPPLLIVVLVTTLTALLTEVASNTATASVVMPILRDMAMGLCINPLYLIIPATACCCYAFMLPAATPPNAIVYSSANIPSSVMIKAGIVTNVICVIVINVMINTLGGIMFHVWETPVWMNSTVEQFDLQCSFS